MMCFGETVDDNLCKKCKPFVLSAKFEPKNKNNESSKLSLKTQFKNSWKHNRKTKEKTGEMLSVFFGILFYI